VPRYRSSGNTGTIIAQLPLQHQVSMNGSVPMVTCQQMAYKVQGGVVRITGSSLLRKVGSLAERTPLHLDKHQDNIVRSKFKGAGFWHGKLQVIGGFIIECVVHAYVVYGQDVTISIPKTNFRFATQSRILHYLYRLTCFLCYRSARYQGGKG
jgi:hypothetical protein